MTFTVNRLAGLPEIPERIEELTPRDQWKHYTKGSLAFLMAAQQAGIRVNRTVPLLSALDDVDGVLNDDLRPDLAEDERDEMLGYLEQLSALEDTESVGAMNAARELYVTYNAAGRLSLRSGNGGGTVAEAARQPA